MKNTLIATLAFVCAMNMASAQSYSHNKTKINVKTDDLSLKFESDEGEITKFEINGEAVKPADYVKMLEKYDGHLSAYNESNEDKIVKCDPPKSENDQLHIALKEALMEEGYITNTNKYHIKLSNRELKINRDKISDNILAICSVVYYKVTGRDLDAGTKVEIKKNGGSTSVSIRRS